MKANFTACEKGIFVITALHNQIICLVTWKKRYIYKDLKKTIIIY